MELSKQQVKELYLSLETRAYQKRGTFIYRPAENFKGVQESVLTIVAGKLETIKQSKPGEVVVRNIVIGSSAETYIIPQETFAKRYDQVDEPAFFMDGYMWMKAVAKGKINATQYQGEASVG